MTSTSLTLGLALSSFALSAAAEDALTALPAPEARSYPYEILGLQPGDPLSDVLAIYAERSDAAPTSESEVLRVQSPAGNVFEFTYQQFSRIGDVGVNGRLAGAAQDQVTAGPVTVLCRSDCSFKRPFFRRPRGFSSPMLSGVVEDCRTR